MKRPTPNTQRPRSTAAAAARKDGVALIICLGLLAVMTLMAVTFSISMRVERLAARNYADSVRAKHLVNTALVRTMKDIDAHMAPATIARRRVYPSWTATNSTGTGANYVDLLTPQALRFIPGGELMKEASNARPEWVATDLPHARIAYLVVNSSGLVDANSFGNAGDVPRVWSTNVQEVDIDNAGEFKTGSTMEDFVNERKNTNVRYETIDELAALSTHLEGSISNFTTFSFEPGRDELFLTTVSPGASWWTTIDRSRPPGPLGTRDAEYYLHDKFNINSITNFSSYWSGGDRNKYKTDNAFMTQYWTPLRDMLRDAVLTDTGQQSDRPDDVAWNIVNYLDPDRVPQGDITSDLPWTKSEGGESIPMINEIVVTEKQRTGLTNGYEYYVTAEVWYPYAPLKITPGDEFGAQLWIWTNTPPTTLPTAEEIAISNSATMTFSATLALTNMVFGGDTEFILISNRNPIVFFDSAGTNLTRLPVTATPTSPKFWLLARVTTGDILPPHPGRSRFYIVDEAMGYDRTDIAANRRAIYVVDSTSKIGSYQVNDPRSNGQIRYWNYPTGGGNENGRMFPVNQNTLGTTNRNCSAFLLKGSGLPIYCKDAPMNNIGELGHIWRSNLDDELRSGSDIRNAWWRTLDLMRKTEGSMLLDMMTTRNPRPPYTGTFCANSKQKDAWRILFNNLVIGNSNLANTAATPVDPGAREAVIRELVKTNFVSFTDMFSDAYSDAGGGGPLADAFRACAPGDDPNDIYKEDTFRHLCELFTFRQNIFTIILAAQVMSEEGAVPIAERRAVATVYRDAYTGRRFIRNFTWLDD